MRKFFKILLYVIGCILVLLLLVVIWLNTPWGKNFVRVRLEAYLRGKIKTELHIGGLGYGLPKYVVLEDVLFKDQARDTLLAVKKLEIDLDMLKLISKKVDVREVLLQGVHSHVYRNRPDTNFNFTYIIDAFTSGSKADTAKAAKKKDTSSSAMSIDLDRVKFDDIHVRFDDYTGGMRLALNLDHLNLRMKKIDLDKMAFHIKELTVDGLATSFAQDTSLIPLKPDTSTSKTQMQLIADKIDLSRINFQYNNALNKFLFGLNLGKLNIKLKQFDLAKNFVDLDDFALANTSINLVIGKSTTAPKVVDTVVKIDTTEGWHVVAAGIDLSGVNFKMDNENSPRQPAGIDYSHLDVKNLALKLQSLSYTSDSISGNIQHLAVQEQSGLDVRELKTVFNYNPQGATLQKLYLQTSNTVLQDHLEVHYPSLQVLKTNMRMMQLRINLAKSIIGLRDVLVFVPDLRNQELFKKFGNGHLSVNATVLGFLNALDIRRFDLSGMDNTEVSLTGKLNGLPDAKTVRYDLNIAKLQSSRNDVTALLPPNTLSSVRLPDKFGIAGHLAGTTQDYYTHLFMMSTDGAAYLDGKIAMSPGKGRETYDMIIKTQQLNVGRILKQDSTMGAITATITAKGTGFDINTMAASLTGDIQAAMLKGYNYYGITFNGKVASKKGDISLTSTDPNAHLALEASADLSGKYAAATASIVMDSVDMQALKLYSSELRMRGNIDLDFPELNPDYPRGEFVWRRPTIVANGQKYLLDSIYVISHPSQDTGQNIIADLDVMHAVITGKTPLSKIGDIIKDHINRHYAFKKDTSASDATVAATPNKAMKMLHADTTQKAIPADYDLTLNATVYDAPLLHGVLPGLTSLDTISIYGNLTPKNLLFTANIPEVVYGSTTIENGNVNVTGADSAFTYFVTVDQVKQSKINLWYADVRGNLDQNNITANISISDSVKKERFALAATLQKNGDTQVVHLNPGLKLDYQTWQVAQPNRMAFAPQGFYIENFGINNGNQYIKINSTEPRPGAPLKADISNFLLADITNIISSDTILANGVLGGTVTVEKFQPSMQLNSQLQIKDLSLLSDTLGDLNLQVNSTANSGLDTKLALKGHGNDVDLNGTYYLQPSNSNDFDFNLDMNALSMASLDGILNGEVRNSTGYLRGKLHLQGTPSAAQVTGEINTDQYATTVKMLNAYFKMPSEKISFTTDGVRFDNFTIQDSAGNKAVLTGTVATSDLSNLAMDLHIKAHNWRAVHSSPTDNKDFYGDLLLNTNLDIKGTPTTPDIEGNIGILKGTKLTVVTPEKNPQIESSDGIVEFVSMRDTDRYRLLAVSPQKKKQKKTNLSPGSNINVNVNINKDAELSLIIDQASGDFLRVRGDASLNASITPGGSIGLTGNYQLHEGAYQLNYNFIKRLFTIKDGSTITFGGDPTKNTSMDITAVYSANVPPYDLVEKLVTDPSQLNYYKQNLPFDVEMHMHGSVLKPTLTFDIVLPENGVYPLAADQIELIQGKLNQIRTDTSELNKQVFALLILNRFVSEDPFNSGVGNSLSSTAMQSVSRFIGEQLNQFANKLVKGVDLSVDLASSDDYTTGELRQRTDLNVAASKRLLNDRLKLTVGNDFELEGPQGDNNDQSTLIPSNLAADYLLSADGRYTMRVYRKNYNEGVLQGYVTETGLNFIVSLDFNRFKDIFRKKKKEQSSGKPKSTNSAK